MNVTTRRWLACAQAHTLGNGRGRLSYWAYAMVKAADLTEEEKDRAMATAKKMLDQGKLRGDISEQWIKDGFTHEQFRNELFL